MSDLNGHFDRRPLTPGPTFKFTTNTFDNAMIGEEYRCASRPKIPDQCEYKHQLKQMMDSIQVDAIAGKGAIFYGGYGHGKSCAAVIMLKIAATRQASIFFRKARFMKAAWEKPWAYFNRENIPIWDMMTRTHFAALDDLGAELAQAGYEKGDIRVMESIIRERYDARIPTYITTNLELDDLMAAYPSLNSIFLDPTRYYLVEVTGYNWRNPAGAKRRVMKTEKAS